MINLLSVENLTMKFGGLTAIDDLSFDAKNNQITSIIGPNGCLLYTSPSPRDEKVSRMPSSA